jgi:hypothetical protein
MPGAFVVVRLMTNACAEDMGLQDDAQEATVAITTSLLLSCLLTPN